jgi:lipopolysaccharide/colanic/teichoic acid biosynthesis glycosyltransferase
MRRGTECGYLRWVKRPLDTILALPLIVISLPLIVVLACGSAAAFRSWPIFLQRRVGRHGRLFWVPKIRTLPGSAPRGVDKYSLELQTNRFGRFLRRTHLDEFPQLWLVPLGRMSLVGPRPEMPELLDRYPVAFAELRARVRPGCTGLWQLSPAACGLIYEAPLYDEYYVEQVSFRLDARLLRETFLILLGLNRGRSVEPIGRFETREEPGSEAVAAGEQGRSFEADVEYGRPLGV